MHQAKPDHDEIVIFYHDFEQLFPESYLREANVTQIMYEQRDSPFTFASEWQSTILGIDSPELLGDSIRQTTQNGARNQATKDKDFYQIVDGTFTMRHKMLTGCFNYLLLQHRFMLGKFNMHKDDGAWSNNIGDISIAYVGPFATFKVVYKLVTINLISNVSWSYDGSTEQEDFTVTYGFGDMQVSVDFNESPNLL